MNNIKDVYECPYCEHLKLIEQGMCSNCKRFPTTKLVSLNEQLIELLHNTKDYDRELNLSNLLHLQNEINGLNYKYDKEIEILVIVTKLLSI